MHMWQLLQARHGALLAVGELVLALHAAGKAVSGERLAAVAGLVPALRASRLYRGKGGELIRAAACRRAVLSLAAAVLVLLSRFG